MGGVGRHLYLQYLAMDTGRVGVCNQGETPALLQRREPLPWSPRCIFMDGSMIIFPRSLTSVWGHDAGTCAVAQRAGLGANKLNIGEEIPPFAVGRHLARVRVTLILGLKLIIVRQVAGV